MLPAKSSSSCSALSRTTTVRYRSPIHGLRGELHVTWEEGTWAAWLYDLLQPQVMQVLVCDPRRNA